MLHLPEPSVKASHAHRRSQAGGVLVRSADVENVLASIHDECDYTVARQVHVPRWNRWKWHCESCNRRGTTWDHPGAPCDTCGAATEVELEKAVPDGDLRSARVPCALLDTTIRYKVPRGNAHLAAAARGPGA